MDKVLSSRDVKRMMFEAISGCGWRRMSFRGKSLDFGRLVGGSWNSLKEVTGPLSYLGNPLVISRPCSNTYHLCEAFLTL